jgi:hypothetical protein
MRLLPLLLMLLPALALAIATGEARDRDGNLLYVEHHRLDGTRHEIEYRDADGELFATNSLDYRYGDTHPAYRQHLFAGREPEAGGSQYRTQRQRQRQEGARWQQGALVLFHSEGDREREKRVDVRQPLVLSSGFDRFVRGHWEALQRGDQLRFHFGVPARLSVVELRLLPVPSDEVPAGGLALRAEAASRLLRLVSSPIELLYDGDRRLLRYRGVSNLPFGESAPWVEITYRYDKPSDAARPGLVANP